MVVVLIIAVMTAIGVAKFTGFFISSSVKNASRDVCSTMRLAHSKAATDCINYLAVFNLNNETTWVQPYSGFDPDDSDTWNPDFGSEKKLPDGVIIARVTADSGGQGTGSGNPEETIDTGIGYYKYSSKGTSQLGFVYLRDSDNKIQYKVKSFSTAQAQIIDYW